VSLSIANQPVANAIPAATTASREKQSSPEKHGARSFSSYLKAFSESSRDAAAKKEDRDDSNQTKPHEPIPVQLQIPLLATPAPQTAPLAAEMTSTPALLKDAPSAAEPAPLLQEESKAAPEHKVATPQLVSTPLALQDVPNVSFQVNEQPLNDEKVDHPLRPPTAHLEAKVAGVDGLNPSNRPSTQPEWMASPSDAEGDQAADSKEDSEVAFAATIKEAVQPLKAKTSEGKNEQQDSNAQERSAHTAIPSGPQPQIEPEKTFHQTVTQDKPAEAAKAPDMTAIHPVLNERTANTGAVNSISLNVDPNNSGLDVKLVERDGTIQVSVRTSDRELAGDIRGRLNELVDGLSGKGYETQTWIPDEGLSAIKQTSQTVASRAAVDRDSGVPLQPLVSSTFQAQNDSRNLSHEDPGKGSPYEDQPGGRHPQGGGRQQERQSEQREKPKNIFRTILEGARP
jgi:hypothetical protein